MIGRFLNQIAEPTTSRWLVGLLLLVLILFPWAMGEGGRYYTVLLMTVFIFATIGHAWNLLAGFCGLLSFGIQVYIGLGGFTVAILKYYLNVPVWWAMILSIIVTAAMAILRPLLAETGAPKLGKMVIGTVKGDIHGDQLPFPGGDWHTRTGLNREKFPSR